MTEPDIFNRTRRLIGNDALSRLAESKVIIFGIGGVGSWTAEALIRSGITNLTIVDADVVAASNINRQLPATTLTIGEPKVDVLRSRLLEINPHAQITAIKGLYSAETAHEYDLTEYDCVIDAIDSLKDKAALILHATSTPHIGFFSSMGAALKMDPTRISVAEFWKVKGCPLAAALRHKFKRSGTMPRRKFKCVYSDELLKNAGDEADSSGAMTFGKVRINGAMCHITAIFGLTLAGLAIEYLTKSLPSHR
ncbi:MAG: tRNA threonylcarbamoyladenosine dehydratase [Muribaculaceae bacterium]|nr:tRNA threonylcarbamoyladenosine dehydratase [Muribaculaceae bacterium]